MFKFLSSFFILFYSWVSSNCPKYISTCSVFTYQWHRTDTIKPGNDQLLSATVQCGAISKAVFCNVKILNSVSKDRFKAWFCLKILMEFLMERKNLIIYQRFIKVLFLFIWLPWKIEAFKKIFIIEKIFFLGITIIHNFNEKSKPMIFLTLFI